MRRCFLLGGSSALVGMFLFITGMFVITPPLAQLSHPRSGFNLPTATPANWTQALSSSASEQLRLQVEGDRKRQPALASTVVLSLLRQSAQFQPQPPPVVAQRRRLFLVHYRKLTPPAAAEEPPCS